MPYPIQDDQIKKVADLMEEYYNDAWQVGVKNLFSNMARSNMSGLGSFLDQAADSYTNLRKKSSDAFTTTFKADIKLSISVYCANKSNLKTDFVNIGEKVLLKAAEAIPVPYLGTIFSKAIQIGAENTRNRLHDEGIVETDKQFSSKSGAELEKLFVNDAAAMEFIKKSMTQYQTIGKLISAIPITATSFEEAITLPKSVFKIQSAVSSLNIAMWNIQQYLSAMQERLIQADGVCQEYIQNIRNGNMKTAVAKIIQEAYSKGYEKGVTDLKMRKHTNIDRPKFENPKKPGGATHLANYVAHATATGYFDALRDAQSNTFARISQHW